MAPVFMFAEQVRSMMRSGKKELDIPEGTRISPAAADLIKEYNIKVKTVAPNKPPVSKISEPNNKSTETARTAIRKKQAKPQAKEINERSTVEISSELSEDELEEIVSRIIERFKQVKGNAPAKTALGKPVKKVQKKDDSADDDDLIICRCEEISRSEIKAAIRNGIHTLNGLKRVTRAGMGLCQGQTCQQLVARILTEELGLRASDIDPTTARGPVRPLRLEVFANS